MKPEPDGGQAQVWGAQHSNTHFPRAPREQDTRGSVSGLGSLQWSVLRGPEKPLEPTPRGGLCKNTASSSAKGFQRGELCTSWKGADTFLIVRISTQTPRNPKNKDRPGTLSLNNDRLLPGQKGPSLKNHWSVSKSTKSWHSRMLVLHPHTPVFARLCRDPTRGRVHPTLGLWADLEYNMEVQSGLGELHPFLPLSLSALLLP